MAISWTRTRTISLTRKRAPVVRQIYQLCLAGNGPTKIARMLTEQQIPTPGTLEYRRTAAPAATTPGYECKWATNTVVHILENREYTGCLVNFKTEKPSLQGQTQRRENPVENRPFSPNHRADYRHGNMERVQGVTQAAQTPERCDEVGLFSGMLFCATAPCDVPAAVSEQEPQAGLLHLRRLQEAHPRLYGHFIRTDLLTAGVLQSPASDGIRRQA